jgi:hypothetical protein
VRGRIPDGLPPYDEYDGDHRIVVVKQNGNGLGYQALIQTLFVGMVLGGGALLWKMGDKIEAQTSEIAVLKVKCANQPVERGS